MLTFLLISFYLYLTVKACVQLFSKVAEKKNLFFTIVEFLWITIAIFNLFNLLFLQENVSAEVLLKKSPFPFLFFIAVMSIGSSYGAKIIFILIKKLYSIDEERVGNWGMSLKETVNVWLGLNFCVLGLIFAVLESQMKRSSITSLNTVLLILTVPVFAGFLQGILARSREKYFHYSFNLGILTLLVGLFVLILESNILLLFSSSLLVFCSFFLLSDFTNFLFVKYLSSKVTLWFPFTPTQKTQESYNRKKVKPDDRINLS